MQFHVSVLFFFFLPGLFPAVLNLATMANITTNATCGSVGPEMFCKLVEHVPGQPVTNPQCRICNQRSANPSGKKKKKRLTTIYHYTLAN